MKSLMKVVEIEGEGLETLLEKPVMLFALNYIYAGTLVGVNESFVKITNASIVYETGPFGTPGYKDAQSLPGDCWYIQRGAIESFGLGK